MCGLAGVALGPKRRRTRDLLAIADAFTELLVLNEARGRDASGLAVIDRDGGHALVKRPVPASLLVEYPAYEAILDEVGNQTAAILGHTRKPTRGSVTNPLNNQPLRRGRTIGAANGTIENADWLGYDRFAEVDSEILVLAADCSPSLAEFVRRIREMTGYLAAAIVKLDDSSRVQLLRGNRPLAILRVDHWDATFWSSEADHLVEVLGSAREVGPMTGITIRDGRPVRRYRLALREEARRWTDDAVCPGSTDPYEPQPLFAYGTLRPGMWNDRFWVRDGGRAKPVVLPDARLYHMAYGFPAVILGETSDGVIRGDLVHSPDMPALLKALDWLEGYRPDSPGSSHYLRVRVEVVRTTGERVPAWIYVYDDARLVRAEGAELVPAGDWCAWLEAKGGARHVR